MRLTDKTLNALKSKPRLFKVTDDRCPGLTLRVHPGGTKSWYIRKIIELDGAKKRVEFRIGNFPAMNCTQARAEFHQQTSVIDNALSHAVSAARSRVTGLTLGKLVQMYIGDLELTATAASTLSQYRTSTNNARRVARGVIPIQDALCSSLTRPVVKEWFRSLVRAGYSKSYTGNLVWLFCAAVEWGIDEELIATANTFATLKRKDLKRIRPDAQRERVLSDDELRHVWNFHGFQANPARSAETQTILRMLILTGLRRADVVNLQWSDIAAHSQAVKGLGVFDLIIIPAERTKTRVAYSVPMFGPLRVLLEQYADRIPQNKRVGPVFPHTAGKSIEGILSALHRDGVTHTIHDIRRTVATRLSQSGVPRESVRAVLQHTKGGNASDHYIHHKFIGQKVEALARWFDMLAPVVAGGEPVVVLPGLRELVA